MSHLLPSCQLPPLLSRLQHPPAPFAIRSQSRPRSRAPARSGERCPLLLQHFKLPPARAAPWALPSPSPVVVPQAQHKSPQLHALCTAPSLSPCPHSPCKPRRQRILEQGAHSGGHIWTKQRPGELLHPGAADGGGWLLVEDVDVLGAASDTIQMQTLCS